MKHQIKEICAKDISENWVGDGEHPVQFLSGLGFTDFQTISFYKGEDLAKLSEIKSGILIVKQTLENEISSFSSKSLVFVAEPMSLFADLVNENFSDTHTDLIVEFPDQKFVSSNAYIESDVTLGENVKVFPNAAIFNGSTLGNNCIIQAGAIVGGNGMTYLEGEDHVYKRMTQIGKIIIEDDVVIGCNSVVLRGILEYTRIGKGTKIGNLVNVGHNCIIGKDCYISSSAVIGGATTIGDNCWIAPGSSIRDNIKIGDNCTIGLGSVVVKDTEPNSIYYGNPAKLIKYKN